MPSVRGKKVVIVGDSLSAGPGTPGQILADHLKAQGAADVKVVAKVGRSAYNLYQREDTASIMAAIRAFHPDLGVVVLGSNDIGLSMSIDQQAMSRLRSELAAAGAEVWAFGPPSFAAGTRFADGAPAVAAMMKRVFGARFLDLRPLTADLTSSSARTPDKVHFTSAGAKAAGERMAERFLEASSGTAMIAALVVVALAAYIGLR